MEIYKRQYKLIFALLIILVGCNIAEKGDVTEEKHKQELYEERRLAKGQQVLLENWFQDFTEIQSEIFSINTNELLSLEFELENTRTNQTDKERIIGKIKEIKALLEKKDYELKKKYAELKDNNQDFSGLKSVINSLRNEVKRKENEINNLQYEFDEIIAQNSTLQKELKNRIEEINRLNENNKSIKKQLNKKYLFLISAKEIKIIPLDNNVFRLNYKSKDILVLSEHPKNSYQISKNGRYSSFNINNGTNFWNGSNYLVVRIKKRTLL